MACISVNVYMCMIIDDGVANKITQNHCIMYYYPGINQSKATHTMETDKSKAPQDRFSSQRTINESENITTVKNIPEIN